MPGPRLAAAVVHAALLCYFLITTLNMLKGGPSATEVTVVLACMGAIYGIQLLHSAPHAARTSARRKTLTLGAQVLLTYLPLAAFGLYWGAMAGFLAGSILLLLPARWAWPLYGLVGMGFVIPPYLDGTELVHVIYMGQTTLLTGLVTFGLARLRQVILMLHETREELGRMAVTTERLRFARDLHDLLGYSLSAITLKGELVHRLIAKAPDRAAAEVGEILVISRQALADVRVVASGYRTLSLADEIRAARAGLAAAGMQVRGDVRPGPLDPDVDTVLATVLREAVTNILRHSSATYCRIDAVREGVRVRLTVTNDGVRPGYRDASPHGGSGLGNLELRLRAVGGSLTREDTSETFVLSAEAPAGRAGG
ncbi:sensor histidine kinase [Yinghuangia seranimata]|uniref:sensor histidine kinase n=1 Tax=Yinghuangia seranimata TaxID=408067 RepID=UPI00248C0E8E|nr:histidine kinase [Yinghuangia seranimata]MDI2128409.1 histidine kinase [Yinghuangia seranimata]